MGRGKRNMNSKGRREVLVESLKPPKGEDFITTVWLKVGMEPYGSRRATCTITGHCRTFVFKFPGSYLVAEEPLDHQLIYSREGFKASIVSNFQAYFEQEPADSLHYSIDVSLRASVRSIHEKAVKQPTAPLFIVIEEHMKVPPTELNSGECVMIDECCPMIEGGREGERALFALPTSDGSWPDVHVDMHVVNVVLAAVKVEQNVAGPIEKLCSCSCFVSSERQAVYTSDLTMEVKERGGLPYQKPPDLGEKARRIGARLQGMMSDSAPAAPELFDSILLDKTEDDGYLRLWYLRLWQALDDAKKDLGYTQAKIDTVIAGKRTLRELTEYRNDIAHWHTGRIDYAYLKNLQLTAMELLRRKYGPTS